MSFGSSLSDFVTLIQLTTKTYKGWRDTCGDYGDIASTIFSYQVVLQNVHLRIKKSNESSTRTDILRDLQAVLKTSNNTIKKLRAIEKRYERIGTSQRLNWRRIKLGCKNLDSLLVRLSHDLHLMSILLAVEVGQSIHSCRLDISKLSDAVKGGVPVALGNIIERNTGDEKTVSPAFTTYENDSKEVWRQLRREMINLGFKSHDVTANEEALLEFIRSETHGILQRRKTREIMAPMTQNQYRRAGAS
ncbi:hypothetical protein BDV96DRAFT_688483 [Lophiotrema nucula]|uniref:Fungal N-terminal domain-containing protein n=1 Tax=Lophiotrema nucula TaxID=690887 RepID=A0A6A5Z5H7_9PLEO|nr:hypothetical protein BDV96DRAFT_688483 [Lophiotrema nucula]